MTSLLVDVNAEARLIVFEVPVASSVIVTSESTKMSVRICPLTPPVIVATVFPPPFPVTVTTLDVTAKVVAAAPSVTLVAVLDNVPEKVPLLAVIGASALSSASRKATVVDDLLIDGKLDVVPPNCSLAKSVIALFDTRNTPSEGEAI